MKILICGGHLSPALAVMQHMPKNAEIVYVGRMHPFEGDPGLSLEYQTIQKLGIKFIPLTAGRLQRKWTRHTVSSLLKLPKGLKDAMRIVRSEKPDIVLGFGGYISLPLGIAAKLQKIPLIIHEQTLTRGFTNKLLTPFATKIAISWETSRKYFPKKKTELTGDPHFDSKPSTAVQTIIKESKSPRIVITGGSGGSHVINMLIEHALPLLLERYTIIHQTGDAKEFGDFERLEQAKKTLPKPLQENYVLMKFIHPLDFDYLYNNADLVISRAGINTIVSIILLQKPAILIPLAHGQKNDQPINAAFVKKLGLGEVIDQNADTKKLLETIERMLIDIREYKKADVKQYQELHTHAAEKIVELVYVIHQVNTEKKN